jgi:16S rRNA (cytosine967-C5)-methyltransferase
MATQKASSRLTAADILHRWLTTGDFPDRILHSGVSDQPFVMEVVYGCAKWQRLLLWVIRRCSDGKPQKALVPFLMIGIYQILFMENVPPYAAVNETVEASKKSSRHAAGYVNSVLRRALREKDNLLHDIKALPLPVRESHPDILVERWKKTFGPAKTARLCRWNNDRAFAVIRPNLSKTTFADFLQLLRSASINAVPHPFRPEEFISLPHGIAITGLPGFTDGIFFVHDPSTAEAVNLLDPAPGDTVLDACAAPGGKTVLLAERIKGNGRIVAMDIYDDRLALLRENIARMNISCVEIIKGDASAKKLLTKYANEPLFDRILLDAPCSNTGVLQRRPDARWRFSAQKLSKLNRLQTDILNNVSFLLKVGGILVYSTCSIEPEEGTLLIDKWLRDHDGFKLIKKVSLFPPDTATDGIFAASMQRVS